MNKEVNRDLLLKGFDFENVTNSQEADVDIEQMVLRIVTGASMKILYNSLGKKWFKKYLDPASNSSEVKHFFNVAANQNVPLNLIFLAEYIYQLCDKEGFDNAIEKFKNQNLYSILFELKIANDLSKNEIKFNKETGIKGKDYDLSIHNDRLVTMCVECKYIKDSSGNSRIVKSLRAAKHQLPYDSPGMIFIRINHKFLENQVQFESLKEDMIKFLTNSSNINKITICAEKIEHKSLPVYVIWKKIEIDNPCPAFTYNKDIQVKTLEDHKYLQFGGSTVPCSFVELSISKKNA